MFKKLLRNRKGTAEIVGTALFLVILIFFFSNVFLWHNRASREMDQTIANKMNSAVLLETTVGGSGNFTPCTGDPIFGGFGRYQTTGDHVYDPPPFRQDRGPPYGMIVSGSYNDTTTKNVTCQVLSETGALTRDGLNDDYMCLNATYSFRVDVHSVQDLRLMNAITLSLYGNSSDAEGEAVDVYLYNVRSKGFVSTGLEILRNLEWYNITVPNPERYIDLTSGTGTVTVNYMSSRNSYYWDESSYLAMYIDCQLISVDPIALKVSDLGGRDIRLERLWITEVNTNNHVPINLTKDSTRNPMEVWVAAGSSVNIVFGSTTKYDATNNVLTINYQPPPGKVIFKVLTNLGNTATTTFDFPS